MPFHAGGAGWLCWRWTSFLCWKSFACLMSSSACRSGDTTRSFGGVKVVLGGDCGQLPVPVSPERTLLCRTLLARASPATMQQRVSLATGPYKESLLRVCDVAHTKEDAHMWRKHDLASPACEISIAERCSARTDAQGSSTQSFRFPPVAAAHFAHLVSGQLPFEPAQKTEAAAARSGRCSCDADAKSADRAGTGQRIRGQSCGRARAVGSRAKTGRDASTVQETDLPGYTGPEMVAGHAVPCKQLSHEKLLALSRTPFLLVFGLWLTVHKSQGLTLLAGCVFNMEHDLAAVKEPWACFCGHVSDNALLADGF